MLRIEPLFGVSTKGFNRGRGVTPAHCISGKGEFGDCYRACLATILDLPASEVPHFGALNSDSELMWSNAREWLAPRGLGIFVNWVNGEWPLEKLLKQFSEGNPGVPFIVHGEAALKGSGDINHAIVALDGEIAHDPSGAGIAGPAVDLEGKRPWWWIEIIALRFAIVDGTATAALCEDIAVPQDCQARAEGIAQKGSHD